MTRRVHPPDPLDPRRSSRAIGWQVTGVSAVLVLVGAALAVGYLFWQTRPAEEAGGDPGSVRVFVEPANLVIAGLIVGAGAVLCAGGAAWLIARRAVRPLAEAARIQERFVADASHELRTPLAVLSARAQHLALLTPADDPRREIVGALRADARIMSEVVDDMLAAATGAPVRRGACVLADVVAGVVADLGALAAHRGVSVRMEPQPGVTPGMVVVALPEPDLRRCLVALVDNAIDHSPPGGTVVVSAEIEAAVACITVADGGSGIVGIAPERIFDRFAHGAATARGSDGAARTRFGIGLSLVKDVVERHGGDVRVVRTGPDGTAFALRAPLAAEGAR